MPQAPKLLTLRGETRPLKTWARLLGLKPETIRTRLNRGLSVEEALSTTVRSYRPWTREDDALLRGMWEDGVTVEDMCKALNRSHVALRDRAHRLSLRAPIEQAFTLRDVERASGYSGKQIKNAASRLGLRLYRATEPHSRIGPKRRGRKWGLTLEQVNEILAYLKEHQRDGLPFHRRSAWEWRNRKPAHCRWCKETGRRHYVHGYCSRCHLRAYRVAHGLIAFATWVKEEVAHADAAE